MWMTKWMVFAGPHRSTLTSSLLGLQCRGMGPILTAKDLGLLENEQSLLTWAFHWLLYISSVKIHVCVDAQVS